MRACSFITMSPVLRLRSRKRTGKLNARIVALDANLKQGICTVSGGTGQKRTAVKPKSVNFNSGKD